MSGTCLATLGSFIRARSIIAEATHLANIDSVSFLHCWRGSLLLGFWSALQYSTICFCRPFKKNMTGHFRKGMTAGRCQVGKGCDGYGWVVSWFLPDLETDDSAESTTWFAQSTWISTELNYKGGVHALLFPNKPLAIIISPVFWLIANVPCIEATCGIPFVSFNGSWHQTCLCANEKCAGQDKFGWVIYCRLKVVQCE